MKQPNNTKLVQKKSHICFPSSSHIFLFFSYCYEIASNLIITNIYTQDLTVSYIANYNISHYISPDI
ncbi:hypothetical protein PRUPE_1G499200 [Prunus persica]|uniref:Uncharacterized protein n=1 Tax=Prunus persica TaxID=3760 RepID=A0A251RFQ1_PRUPE|nr:hypothetical protein PRUPE_1G499200 [Prunus persica]